MPASRPTGSIPSRSIFEGRFDKASTIKGFLDSQLRSAKEVNFEATYTLTFPSGLSLVRRRPEAFQKNLTKYGSGEAYVEAHAAAQGVARMTSATRRHRGPDSPACRFPTCRFTS